MRDHRQLGRERVRDASGRNVFADKLFDIERDLAKLPPDKRRTLRRQRAGPVIDALRVWRDQMLERNDVHEGTPIA